MKRFFVAGLSAVQVLLFCAPSFAYCRTRTCEFDPTVSCEPDPQTQCSTVGVPAFWGSSCIPFAIHEEGSPAEGISASDMRELVEEGFELWTGAACDGGGTPELSYFFRGAIDCAQVEYNCGAGDANNNIIMFRDGASDLEQAQLALSILTANLDTGEIFDVDIEINSRDWDFAEDRSGPRKADLRQVINHELGHLLGLSHSLERGALMRASYGDISEPGDDDVAGVCEVFGGAASDPVCEVEPLAADAGCVGSEGRCAVTVEGVENEGCVCAVGARSDRSAAYGWLGVLALGVLRGFRARRSRRAGVEP